MCFFNTMTGSAVQIAARYRRKFDAVEAWKAIMAEREPDKITKLKELYQYRLAEQMYNIPAYNHPHNIIISDSDQLQVMDWGLIPRRAKVKDKERYQKANWFVNARAEDIFDTWPYRNLIRRNRCIMPSTGYMEYHYNTDGTTQPYLIYLIDQPIFSFGALWDTWENPETGEIVKFFVQITTEANPFTRRIHNGGKNPYRMPLILHPEDEQRWLDPALTDDQIRSLLKVYPADGMAAYPIYKVFKDTDPYDERTLNEDKSAKQGTLDL